MKVRKREFPLKKMHEPGFELTHTPCAVSFVGAGHSWSRKKKDDIRDFAFG